MALPVAPCTQCQQPIVYGDRACGHCGKTFNYGASAPSAPTPAQRQEALAAAGHIVAPAAAAAPLTSAPGQTAATPVQPLSTEHANPLIESGRAQPVGVVAADAVPGLIDSRLFGAMVPEHVPVESLPGIERTVVDDAPLPANDASMAAFLDTGRFEEGEATPTMAVETVPGLIDNRLFGAMVPENIPIPTMEGVERQANSATRGTTEKQSAGRKTDETASCVDCGARRSAAVPICPDCGSSRAR